MVSLDEWLTLYAGTFIFPFPTQWFATILSATEMTKLGHNNPFLFTVDHSNWDSHPHGGYKSYYYLMIIVAWIKVDKNNIFYRHEPKSG